MEADKPNLDHIQAYAPWAKWYAIVTVSLSALAILLTFVALTSLLRQLHNKRFLVVMVALIQCCYILMALSSLAQYWYFLEGERFCLDQASASICVLTNNEELNERNNWNQGLFLFSMAVTALTHSVFAIKYWLMARKIGNLLVMEDGDKYYAWA